MIKIKLFPLLLLISSSSLSLFGQEEVNSQLYPSFSYALIGDSALFIPIRSNNVNKADIILKKKLNTASNAFVHFITSSDNSILPMAWSFQNDTLFSIAIWHSGNLGTNSRIYFRKFQIKDSIEMNKTAQNKEIKEERIFLTPISDYFFSFFKRPPYPDLEKLNQIDSTISFDIQAGNYRRIQFYLRDKSTFFIYNCQIAEDIYKSSWEEVKVYASKQIDLKYPPYLFSQSYSGKKTKYNAIQDSLFFDGHFKVIAQGEDKFIINRKHGNIYFMDQKEIVKIGHVDVQKDYPKIKGKSLFIEDRDNNEILFFAPVQWEKNKYPKPKVRVMTESEMREKFKYVME